MDWVLNLTSSPSFNFGFSFTTYVWITLIGVIIVIKIIKEAVRR